MMDTGLLATWLPFFLMLTRCSPTSRGMKEMPAPEHRLGLVRSRDRMKERKREGDTRAGMKMDFPPDSPAAQSVQEDGQQLNAETHADSACATQLHALMCYQVPRMGLEESPSPSIPCPSPSPSQEGSLGSPMWLLGSLLRRQGSSRPDGALMLAVRVLRSVSLMSSRKSAAEPSFT